MRIIIFSLLVVSLGGILYGQSNNNPISGKVSYISSQNVYVKFESTKNIEVGDTLFLLKDNKQMPALIVNNLSSTSCVCTSISKTSLAVSTPIYAKSRTSKISDEITSKETIPANQQALKNSSDSATENIVAQTKFKQKISGSISATNYIYNSTINDANPTRYQYNLSINARNIGNSKYSAESHISFRHEKDNWEFVQENPNHALKVYNLSVKYDNNINTKIVAGRRINPVISSIGAIDGIQYEGKINNYLIGVFAGSRPNYTDYSFDVNLPQFGAYAGHTYSNSKGEMQNSFALVEQMNHMKTDRRFAYFQHSNSLLKNLYFFGTFEIDLFKNIDANPKSTFSPSSMYLVLNYKLLKRFSFSTSFDNRKNVVYYETYKSYIQQVIDIESRKGLSFQANYHTPKNISFGFKTGYRFPNSNSKETRNIYGYVSYTSIPVVKISATAAVNYLETSHVNGKIINFNVYRDFFKGVLYSNCGYQWVEYSNEGLATTTIQNVINLSINLRFYKKNTFSVNYEKTFEKQNQLSRMTFQLRARF